MSQGNCDSSQLCLRLYLFDIWAYSILLAFVIKPIQSNRCDPSYLPSHSPRLLFSFLSIFDDVFGCRRAQRLHLILPSKSLLLPFRLQCPECFLRRPLSLIWVLLPLSPLVFHFFWPRFQRGDFLRFLRHWLSLPCCSLLSIRRPTYTIHYRVYFEDDNCLRCRLRMPDSPE